VSRGFLNTRLTCREHVDVKMRKTHNLLWACRRACEARWAPKTQGVLQEETKQSTKISMLRDNWSDFDDSNQCYGGTYWPPSIASTDTEGGKVGGTLPLEFGVLV
jgi:hypothetical protein